VRAALTPGPSKQATRRRFDARQRDAHADRYPRQRGLAHRAGTQAVPAVVITSSSDG